MEIGKIVIYADHTTQLICCALIGSDQVARSVTVVCPIRRRKKGEEGLHGGINTDGNATVGGGTAASAGIASRGQQAFMSKRVRDGGDCCGCLHFAEAFIAHKKECAVVHYGPPNAGAELVAHKFWDRKIRQIEVVLGVKGSVAMQFEHRSMKLIACGLGDGLDDSAAMVAIICIEGLGEDAYLREFVQPEKKSGGTGRRKTKHGIVYVHAVDQNVRPTRTHTVNWLCPGRAIGEQ